jgi:hypothetical protein
VQDLLVDVFGGPSPPSSKPVPSSGDLMSLDEASCSPARVVSVAAVIQEDMAVTLAGGKMQLLSIEGGVQLGASLPCCLRLELVDRASELGPVAPNPAYLTESPDGPGYHCSLAPAEAEAEAGGSSGTAEERPVRPVLVLKYRAAASLRPVPVRVQSRATWTDDAKLRIALMVGTVLMSPALDIRMNGFPSFPLR